MDRIARLLAIPGTLAIVLAVAVASPSRGVDAAAANRGGFGPTESLSEAMSGHTATLLRDGRVLVVGGTAQLWDPGTGSFHKARSLKRGRFDHTATLLSDGRVLIVGGGSPRGGVASAELWDPETGSFHRARSLKRGRFDHTATLLSDGRVLIVGGAGRDRLLASTELWDPDAEGFGPTGSLATGRFGHEAMLLADGRVLVTGGWTTDYAVAPPEIWDPDSETFGPAGSLPASHWSQAATLLADGRVLVLGYVGEDPPRGSNQLWDPATESFAPTAALSERRYDYSATLLPDGRVLVIAGSGRNHTLASAELWDPDSGSFGPTGSLAEARHDHTATLLSDGRVLVVGGVSGQGEDLVSAEIWDPAIEVTGSGAPPLVGDHQAPLLELALPTKILGTGSETSSQAGEDAAREWDESFLMEYILASTCRNVDTFTMAILHGDQRVLALRFAGADPVRMREAYMQGRRFVGPVTEPIKGPYGGFVASAGWRPKEVQIGDRVVIDYGVEADGFYAYVVGDVIFEIHPDEHVLRSIEDGHLDALAEARASAARIVPLLSVSAANIRTPGPILEPTSDDCPGADPELLTLLPTQLDGFSLDPFPMPPGFGIDEPELVKATGVTGKSISGELFLLTVGSKAVAYRVLGADPAELESACGPLQGRRKKDLKRVEWGGRRVLIDRDRTSACYVRGDMIFVLPFGLAKAFIRGLPLPS